MKNQVKLSYMPQSKSQTHITPDRVWDLIEDMIGIPADICKTLLYDPCPAHTPYKAPCFFNGLYGDWKPHNYVNPIFKKKILKLFVEKAVEQTKKGNWTIMLLPAKTDQDWFHDIILKNHYRIKWIKGRLQFKNHEHGSPQPHFLVMVR